MNITQLGLYNFRNFTQVDEILLPPDSLLIAAAPNATGKTNFLEALVVLLRGKSWRVSHSECVQWGQDGFTVRGVVHKLDKDTELAVQYHTSSRRLRVEENTVPASPVTFYSNYPLILFLPEDTFIFSRGPAARRNFLNRTLVSRSHYVAALVQYQRALKQRNVALKGARAYSDIAVWTDMLVEHGKAVWQHRVEFIAYVKTHLNELYQQLSGEAAEFSVTLQQSGDEESLATSLEQLFTQEHRYGYTLAGPHRDDLVITMNGRSVDSTLSRGQLRSLTIALKIASWRYIYSVTGEKPIVLLDEVLSELDAGRQAALLSHLPEAQIIMTCTAIPRGMQTERDVHLLDLRSILLTESPAPSTAEPASLPVAEPTAERQPAPV